LHTSFFFYRTTFFVDYKPKANRIAKSVLEKLIKGFRSELNVSIRYVKKLNN
jgi:hypothetical protein